VETSGTLVATGSPGVYPTGCEGNFIDIICPPGAICLGNTCGCPTGLVSCIGQSGDLTACLTAQSQLTDPNNCGHCGIQCPASAPSCQNGTCVAALDASTDGAVTAEAGPDAGSPPSCAPGGPGMTNCGPGGSGTESCCTSLEVTRTYDLDPRGDPILASDGGPAAEADPATVSSFRLDKYEVTVGRFRQFVQAVLPADGGAGWVPVPGSGQHRYLNGGLGLVNGGLGLVNASADDGGVAYEPGWIAADDGNIAPTTANLACDPSSPGNYWTWSDSAESTDTLPINCVNWYEAYAFCIWDGGFLPSEAEWDYAAAGGSQQLEYPWGSTDPGTRSQYAIYDCYYPNGQICSGAKGDIAPVGTAHWGAGLWGHLDLAGSVSEWALDWAAGFAPCVDCATTTPPFPGNLNERLVRGGAWNTDVSSLVGGEWLRSLLPSVRDPSIGFRCARTP
jgi:sulfatase modifying factor 1